jgi:hypothetical protein
MNQTNQQPQNQRNMKLTVTILSLFLSATSFVMAGEKMSDAEIKQKLLGYWLSPRHGYHFTADGIIYMCPRKYGTTTTNRWDVKNGTFYWDSSPHTIITLNDKKFVYREQEPRSGEAATATLLRSNKERVDPD